MGFMGVSLGFLLVSLVFWGGGSLGYQRLTLGFQYDPSGAGVSLVIYFYDCGICEVPWGSYGYIWGSYEYPWGTNG